MKEFEPEEEIVMKTLLDIHGAFLRLNHSSQKGSKKLTKLYL